MHDVTLVEVDLSDTSLYSHFDFDDVYANDESISFSLGEASGEKECCLDPCLWSLFPFDPGTNFFSR